MIGPFRGGRTRALAGVPSQPNVFYIGQVNGGVWKSDDYGRTWAPIFDDQPTQSIGAIAVAPSDPNILYVASGEGLPRPDLSVGDGIYKSTDAGKTWTHLGLRGGQQIPALVVDPREPESFICGRARAILMDRTKNAEFFAPPTAARTGRRSYIRTRTPGALTSRWTLPIRIPFTPRFGRRDRGRGRTTMSSTEPAEDSSSRPTAARRGNL